MKSLTEYYDNTESSLDDLLEEAMQDPLFFEAQQQALANYIAEQINRRFPDRVDELSERLNQCVDFEQLVDLAEELGLMTNIKLDEEALKLYRHWQKGERDPNVN